MDGVVVPVVIFLHFPVSSRFTSTTRTAFRDNFCNQMDIIPVTPEDK